MVLTGSLTPSQEAGSDTAHLPPEEFTRISIHCHFGNCGDAKGADRLINDKVDKQICYDMESAIVQIDEAYSCGFGLLAHTSSNTMNLPYYLLLRRYAREVGIELLPGAEFNLQNWEDKDRFLHVVVVFDPASNLIAIDTCINKAIAENKKNYLTIKQLSSALSRGRAIVCVHGVKQKDDNHSLSKNPEMLHEIAGLNFFMPVAIEDNESYHRETLEAELRKSLSDEACFDWVDCAASVSCSDRRSFSEIKSPTVIWAASTFPDLYHAALMGGSRIKREADAVRKSNYIARIEIDADGGLQQSAVKCSHGLNAIVGQSGSGKTLLLDIINRALTGKALENRSISKDADYSKLYGLSQVHLFDANGEEIGPDSGYKVVEGENLYQLILEMHHESKGELIKRLGIELEQSRFRLVMKEFEAEVNAYADKQKTLKAHSIEFKKTLSQIVSAERFLAANADVRSDHIDYVVDSRLQNDIGKIQGEIDNLTADIESAREHFKGLKSIAERQKLDASFIDAIRNLELAFEGELRKRKLQLVAQKAELEFRRSSQCMVRAAALAFTKAMGEKGKQVSEARQIVVDSFASLASILLSDAGLRLDCDVPALDEKEVSASVSFEDEKVPAKLVVVGVKSKIQKEELPDVLPACVGRRRTDEKLGTTAFEKESYDLCDQDDVGSLVKAFVDSDFEGEIDFSLEPDRLLDYEIQLKHDGGFQPIESLSAGTLGKIYVEHFFDRTIAEGGSNTIILYDQPESNMEKEFVYRSLVRKFGDLRNRYQIFIATHEPLLVVNADSNEIIRATNNKTIGEQRASIGYENCSFVGAAGREEVVRDVARLIDGHEDAVAKRSSVYRGLGNAIGYDGQKREIRSE